VRTRAALVFTLALAALLAAGAAADPSGIFTWIGWTGGPVAALWWWAPYLVYAPALLALAFLGARQIACSGSRLQCFGGLWAIAALATGAAELLYSIALLMPLWLRGNYLIPLASSGAFLLWNTGYALLKMALVGWLPAGLAAAAYPPAACADAEPQDGMPPALFIAGGSTLLLAVLGPWLARNWWQGSPLGYAYSLDAPLFAPTPASGAGRWLAALALIAVLLGWQLARGARSSARRTLPWTSAVCAARTALLLLIVQGLALGLQAGARAADHDLWNLPALFVRAVDAASFALVLAALAGGMALIAQRLPVRRQSAIGSGTAVLALLAVMVGASGGSKDGETPLAAAPSRPHSVAEAADVLPRLIVSRGDQGALISDEQGARVVLRGVNVNQLGEYFQRDPRLPSAQPLAEQDFADIAALGLNLVRLTLSWSQLEPRQGRLSPVYLDRIRQAVAWAKAHRVYVLLDIHQDAWGVHVDAPAGTRCRAGTAPMIGWDGAPAWATLTDGTPPCQVTGRDLAPNVSRAFQSFYLDREGIQSSLVNAWGALAEAFADDPTVVGYDLLNEPNFGESPPLASTLLLANFHARSIAAIRRGEDARAGGFHHIAFFEPSVIWSGFGLDNLPPRQFTPDTQTVFSPHLYNESISVDQDFGLTLVSIERGYALAQAASRQLGVPLWIGEWGYFGAAERDGPLMRRQLAAEDALQLGSAFWIWKQGCSDPHVYPSPVAGNIRRMSCPQMQDIGTATAITQALGRPALRRSPDPAAQVQQGATMAVTGRYRAADPVAACALELWVPGDAEPRARAVSGARLTGVSRLEPGSAALGASGGWLVHACLTGGDYRIELTPPSRP
jgi:hypothetical protein